MTEATATAPAAGPSSTPAAAAPVTETAPAVAPVDPAAKLYPATKPAEPAKSVTEPAATSPEVTTAEKPKEPAPTEPAPLYALPEGFAPPASTKAIFDKALEGAKDGKVTLSPQQLVDLYHGMAKDANTVWQAQIAQIKTDNEAACKARFTAPQLAAHDTAVGWFASYDPAFRDYANNQLSDPRFVNAMRLIGEALQEDGLIPASTGGPSSGEKPKKTPAQRMGYAK